MTKTVRIENADTAPVRVLVEVWEKGYSDPATTVKGAPPAPDTLIETVELGHPTALLTQYITSTRYLVVKEA